MDFEGLQTSWTPRRTVVSIDDFRTSKLCHGCHRELTNAKCKVIGRDFRLHQTKIHSVLHCRNSDCSSMTVNRDVNASANMRDLLISGAHGAKRFWAFSRANKNPEDTCSKVSLGLSSGTDVTTVGKDCTSCSFTVRHYNPDSSECLHKRDCFVLAYQCVSFWVQLV